MKQSAILVSGRRGVFDGTVENMHLHWKYRELVKIIVNTKNFEHVKKIALSLEAESGGVLVSVDKVSKGYAVVVFRGKEYKRPPALRPKNLLTKRKALARSIELQRREVSSQSSQTLYSVLSPMQSLHVIICCIVLAPKTSSQINSRKKIAPYLISQFIFSECNMLYLNLLER